MGGNHELLPAKTRRRRSTGKHVRRLRHVPHVIRAAGLIAAITGGFAAAAPVCALDKTVTLGGVADRWQSIASFDGVVVKTGESGNKVLALDADEYTPDDTTDLLLHFDNANFVDAASHYDIASSSVGVSGTWARIGVGAGVFQGERSGVVLTPANGDALFATGNEIKSFTIEFWMYAANPFDGESLLVWQGARSQGGTLIPQQVRCTVSDGRITWQFKNFFGSPDQSPFDVELQNMSDIVPREWHHYTLRFNSDTGMIESLVDETPAAYAYANPDNRETGTVYRPVIGSGAESTLTIGSSFVGFLDELRISSTYIDSPNTDRYRNTPGDAITAPIDLQYNDSTLLSVAVHSKTPGDTGIFYYVRSADVRSGPNDLPGTWVQFAPGTTIPASARGRYVQFKFELLPDGTGEHTPTVSDLTFTYQPQLPPPPPTLLTAKAGDGSVTLSWHKSVSPDLRGYRIFYGERPSQYFGGAAREGSSPIDVGTVTTFTLNGLTNGSLYYFAVASYDDASPPQLSVFSNEVAARPSTLAGSGQ